MAKRRKPRQVKPPPKATSKVIPILAVAFIGVAVTFLVIDQRTVHILQARRAGSQPAIYSDSVSIERGQKVKIQYLKSELSKRSYRTVSGSPTKEGEYFLSDGQFDIWTRHFDSATGQEISASQVHYTPTTGDLKIKGDDDAALFSLEPQAISGSGSAALRASRFASLNTIPLHVRNSVVAIEDERFFRHFGIDLLGIARAIVVNLREMRVAQGGSTLTQQLAKNVFLSPRRTLGRKILEVFTALSLERQLSKEELLELYLNEVYLGQQGPVAIHGFPEAAQSYFGKDIAQLTVGEGALLAGIIRAPAVYSPVRHLNRAVERRNIVIDQMLSLKMIDDQTAAKARAERILIRTKEVTSRSAPHYMAALRRVLNSDHDLDSNALSQLRVFTGLDVSLQHCAEQAVSRGISDLEKHNKTLHRRSRKLEAGLVAIEPFSGKIKAWAGGRDYGANQFDHVYLARRPVGSTIKPFVYLTALDSKLNRYKTASVTSILADEPITMEIPGSKSWSPENYDHKYRGDVTLRYAIENSLNLPTIYLSQKVGLEAIADNIKRFRIARDIPAVPSLALGTVEATLLDLVSAYGALANGGTYVKPRVFLSALDRDREIVSQVPLTEEKVADEGPVYVLTNLLQGVVERGTATRVRSLGYLGDVAGKTGTTDEARDAWFVGFTPNLAAGVWVGFDDNKRIGLTGGAAAVPIWTEFMKCSAEFQDSLPFIPPPSVSFVTIDSETRMRATRNCPSDQVVEEVFVVGTEPARLCSAHGGEDLQEVEVHKELETKTPPRNRDLHRPRRSFWDNLFG